MILLLGKHQFTVSSIDVCQKPSKSSPRGSSISGGAALITDSAKEDGNNHHLSRTAGPRDLKAAVTERDLTNYLKSELKAAEHSIEGDGDVAAVGSMDGAVLSQIVNEAENFLSLMESVARMSLEEQAIAR